MGAQVLKPDGSGPFKREPPNQDPSRHAPMKEAPQRSGPAPSATPVEPPRKPAGKPRPQRGVFEGDEAAVELRSRLAAVRNGKMAPRGSIVPAVGAALRFGGLVVTAAVAAGVVGYLVGVKLPFKPAARPNAAATGAVDTATLAAHRQPANGALPAVVLPPPDASEIAARLKLGADLMAAGDIAAARTMFARVAEAGDAAGAFALAETYDPAVLGAMRLRGGITPDPLLARQWYEKARDMGSGAAPERIARLAGR